MANLVDDFKNMIPGGVRFIPSISDLVPTVNVSNAPDLPIMEIGDFGITAPIDSITVTGAWLGYSGTATFITIAIPRGEGASAGGANITGIDLSPIKEVSTPNALYGQNLKLSAHKYVRVVNDKSSGWIFYPIRWLVLRIS